MSHPDREFRAYEPVMYVDSENDFKYVDSKRTYLVTNIVTSNDGVVRHYEDEETGIITTDVAKFEKFIDSLVLRR